MAVVARREASRNTQKVQEGVYGYEFSAKNAYLLMRTHCIRDGRMVVNVATGQHRTLDTRVQIPVLLSADDGSKVAYIVGEKRRAGVYLATGVP